METVSLTIPESSEIQTQAKAAQQWIEQFKITDNEGYLEVADFCQKCNTKVAEGESLFAESKELANRLHKRVVALFNAATDPWRLNYKAGKAKLIAWNEEQERERRRKQAELEAEEKRKAEAEQAELAQTMKELGLDQQAQEVLDCPVMPPPVMVPKQTPKVDGFTYRSNWTFDIVDEAAIPREYLVPDRVKIGGVVRALKNQANIPGIKVYETKV